MSDFNKYNRAEVHAEIGRMLAQAERYKGLYHCYPKWAIRDVCDKLSIFDWWHDQISVSQLKQMQKFLKVACDLGYNGYVCFRVGAAGCSHGMWAHKEETTTGYSPDGECLFHSFRNGDNYWDVRLPDGRYGMEIVDHYDLTLDEVKELIDASARCEEEAN